MINAWRELAKLEPAAAYVNIFKNADAMRDINSNAKIKYIINKCEVKWKEIAEELFIY